MTLVLASTSPYRRELLSRIDVPFEVDAPAFDERVLDPEFDSMTDEDFAAKLARGKADSLARRHAQRWILAADQIAVAHLPERTLLHKPGTLAAAVEQLMLLSGKTHTLTTAVVLLNPSSGRCEETVDRQTLSMRSFSREEAQAYVTRHRPLDCVGAYRIEDAGIRLFERIESADYTGIIGLPLLAVCQLLRRVDLLG